MNTSFFIYTYIYIHINVLMHLTMHYYHYNTTITDANIYMMYIVCTYGYMYTWQYLLLKFTNIKCFSIYQIV